MIEKISQLQHLEQTLGLQTYFADPYRSWHRGNDENFNGLMGQDLPEKRALRTVAQEELTMIGSRRNHRPRNRLVFKTPRKCFMLR